MAEPCPVRIRGILYPSMNAAARALGVNKHVVYDAAECGTLDNVGLGRANVGNVVTIRGTRYPTMVAAARALGVCRTTIREACERNTLDNVGMFRK